MAYERKPLDFRFYDMPQKDPILVFAGEKWRRVYGAHSPNLHFHNIIEIGVCREGSGVLQYTDYEETYCAGEISIIPRYTPHNTVNPDGKASLWEYVFVDVHSYLERFYRNDQQLVEKTEERINAKVNLIPGKAHPEIANAVDGIIREKDSSQNYSEEITTSLVLQMLFGIARVNSSYVWGQSDERIVRNRQVSDALQFIDQHYMEQLTIGDLASAVALSETHFRRIFKEAMNMAPVDYLNMTRIQQACALMLRTDDSIEEVSRKTGFTTASTFNRNFKTYMKETPLKWKKAHVGTEKDELGISVSTLRGWDDDTV